MPGGRIAAIAGLACAAAFFAGSARASYEEFSTLYVGREEADDENLLDHVLVEQPAAWDQEWREARNGFRTAQGCFTAAQWYVDHDLKIRVPLGDTAFMALNVRDVSDDQSTYGWTRFDFRFPLAHAGLMGVRFIPSPDKSRQDVGLLWDHGNDVSRFQISAVMGLEDMFNKFWTLRQEKVGDESEPYERHPYEPALHLAWRGTPHADGSRGPQLELNGKWLTPSIKRFDTDDPTQRRRYWLWGVKHDAALTQDWGTWSGALRFRQVQASSFTRFLDGRPGSYHLYGRQFRGEASLARRVGEHGSVLLRFFYQERTQVWGPPYPSAVFHGIDRMPMIEGSFLLPRRFTGRVGFMRNRVTSNLPPRILLWSQGTRVETRAFLSLQKKFGRVRVAGVEGIELDKEPYPVTFHHDKGFLQLQTTF